jgi:hypothetical protein
MPDETQEANGDANAEFLPEEYTLADSQTQVTDNFDDDFAGKSIRCTNVVQCSVLGDLFAPRAALLAILSLHPFRHPFIFFFY